jgi:hypothetical protein
MQISGSDLDQNVVTKVIHPFFPYKMKADLLIAHKMDLKKHWIDNLLTLPVRMVMFTLKDCYMGT